MTKPPSPSVVMLVKTSSLIFLKPLQKSLSLTISTNIINIALGEILRIFSAKKLNKKTCLGTKRMNSDSAQAVMASRLKQTRQTRTGFVSPNFGSGFWADEQTPQNIPPKMRTEFISFYLMIKLITNWCFIDWQVNNNVDDENIDDELFTKDN